MTKVQVLGLHVYRFYDPHAAAAAFLPQVDRRAGVVGWKGLGLDDEWFHLCRCPKMYC